MLVVLLAAAAAILVGTIMVAIGRGGEMTEFMADVRPIDTHIETAADVALLRPPVALWGYDRRSTDEALNVVARTVTERDIEIATLRQQIADMQSARGAGPGTEPGAAGGPPGAARGPGAAGEQRTIGGADAAGEPGMSGERRAYGDPGSFGDPGAFRQPRSLGRRGSGEATVPVEAAAPAEPRGPEETRPWSAWERPGPGYGERPGPGSGERPGAGYGEPAEPDEAG